MKFDKRIKFIKKVTGRDENDYPIEELVDVRSCWASVFTVKGREFFEAAQTQSESTVRFVIRAVKTPLDANMIIEFQGKQYEITSILNDDFENETLTIITKNIE